MIATFEVEGMADMAFFKVARQYATGAVSTELPAGLCRGCDLLPKLR